MTLTGNKIALILMLAVLTWALWGCSESTGSAQTGAGRISPEVSVDADVETSISTDHINITPVPDAQEVSFRLTTADGSLAHTWDAFSGFDPAAPYLPGEYIAEAFFGSEQNEGFEMPYFYGRAEFSLREDEIARPEIICALGNTMMTVDFSPEFSGYFTDCAVTLHSHGGGFVVYTPGERRQAYLRPGDIDVSIALTMPDGRRADFLLTTIPDARAAYCYMLSLEAAVDGTDPVVTMSLDDRIQSDDVSVALTEAFLAGGVPRLQCEGFVSGAPLHVAEGTSPSEPVKVSVSSSLKALLLTVDAPSLLASGWAAEVNLLAMTPQQQDAMAAAGLIIESLDGNTVVDFTALLSRLRADGGDSRSMFALRAVSRSGQMSEPAELVIDLGDVDVELVAVTPATVGVDEASMTVECRVPDAIGNIAIELFSDDRRWIPVTITDKVAVGEAGRYILRFRVPEGSAALTARLLYCGAVKAETKIGRVSPAFTIAVDAFARKAVVKIIPEDESLLSVITRKAAVFNGNERLLGLTRNAEAGEITLTGLSEATPYALRATVMASPAEADFCPEVRITTEKALALPNGDFEEVKSGIDWRDMPSGGRYSQDIVEIFNRQNFVTWKENVPDRWANVNAKTFCTTSRRPNTWYMQPSARTVMDACSGSYAVRIDNVGFDPDGPAIADYVQQGQPYVAYSRVVPGIAYKAVGKLFLGRYSFNGASVEETYEEGIDFESRPSSLNGFYKFQPTLSSSVAQEGMASVEVVGRMTDGTEVVIASGALLLEPATGYTAFSIPLTYRLFGVKATAVRVMLAASSGIGDIPFETASVITVARPDISAMLGSTLWVDGLTFSY